MMHRTVSQLARKSATMAQRRFAGTAVATEKAAAMPTISSESVATPDYKIPAFLTRVPPTQVTTLSNGFRIVTEPRFGETASVGVFIGSGSRQEDHSNNGVAHFLEHMYFKGTKSRSARDLEVEYENAGAYMNAHTSREYTVFTSHCLKNDVERSVDSLADVLLNSEISKESIEAERSTILREMEEVNQNIDEVLFDQLHATAFQGSSLGYTILGPEDNIRRLNRNQMVEYRNRFYTAPRMVLVGTGNIEHDRLVALGERYFGALPSRPLSGTAGIVDRTPEASYIGSDVQVYNPEIPLLHGAIAFEGPGIASGDILTVNLMQIMMGSYDKSMGAGKYVTTPLCQRVANEDYARTLAPFNHAYSDKGLFGMHFISDGSYRTTTSLCLEIVQHFAKFCYKIDENELARAKNLFKNQILQAYEGSLSKVGEEIGRQMLFFGRRPNVAEMFARVDAITVADVKRVAYKYVYDKDPVVVAIGKTEEVPDYTWLRLYTYKWNL